MDSEDIEKAVEEILEGLDERQNSIPQLLNVSDNEGYQCNVCIAPLSERDKQRNYSRVLIKQEPNLPEIVAISGLVQGQMMVGELPEDFDLSQHLDEAELEEYFKLHGAKGSFLEVQQRISSPKNKENYWWETEGVPMSVASLYAFHMDKEVVFKGNLPPKELVDRDKSPKYILASDNVDTQLYILDKDDPHALNFIKKNPILPFVVLKIVLKDERVLFSVAIDAVVQQWVSRKTNESGLFCSACQSVQHFLFTKEQYYAEIVHNGKHRGDSEETV